MMIEYEVKRGGLRHGWTRAIIRQRGVIVFVGLWRDDEIVAQFDADMFMAQGRKC